MKTNFTFPGKGRITALFQEGIYLWVAFFGADELCEFCKCDYRNPDSIYFSLNVTVSEITNLLDDSTYIYFSCDSEVYCAGRISKINPLTTYKYVAVPAGIIEKTIDLVYDSTYIYLLTPGVASGTNAKIIKLNKTTLAYIETINLSDVNNAAHIDIDVDGNLWILSNLVTTTPVITKVYYSGTWQYTNYTLS
jgi:hypothetical protein